MNGNKSKKIPIYSRFFIYCCFLGGLLIDTLRLRSVYHINTLAHWFIDYLVSV